MGIPLFCLSVERINRVLILQRFLGYNPIRKHLTKAMDKQGLKPQRWADVAIDETCSQFISC